MYNLQTNIERLSILSNSKGLSINQMLKNANLAPSVVDNMKRGRIPSIDKIYALADYFDVSIDYLVGRTEETSTQTINNNGAVEINGTQANIINNQNQFYNEITSELLKQFNTLSFSEKLDVFNYIKDKKSMILK